MARFILVLTTCGSKSEAAKIARSLVESRLAACVNIVAAPVESIYRWKGRSRIREGISARNQIHSK